MKKRGIGVAVLWAIMVAVIAGFAASAGATADPAEILKIAPSAMDHPHAGSAVMLDESRAVVHKSGGLTITSRQVVRIFNQRGKGRGEIRLPFNAAHERLTLDMARTIKKDGTVVEVEPGDVREMPLMPSYDRYGDVRAKVVSMPAVEDDCIIEYRWTVERDRPVMPGHYWEEWRVQDYDPVLVSRLSVTLPSGLSPRISYHNIKAEPLVTPAPDGSETTWTWEVTGSPPLESEPHMPPFREVAGWFGITTIGSWDEIARWTWGLFEPRLKTDWDIEAAVKRLTLGKEAPEEKAKAIFYWVESTVRFVGLEPALSGYQPHPVTEIYRRKYGNCVDQSALLTAMLRHAGIDAFPAFLLTSENPPLDRSLPHPAQFNHCIVLALIDGREVWLDPAAETARFGVLPSADRGVEVFVVKNGKGEFMLTPAYGVDENGIFLVNQMTLSEDGTLDGSITRELRGDEEMHARIEYQGSKPDEVRESFKKTAGAIGAGARLNGYQMADFRDPDQPFFTSFTFTAPEWANRTRKFMIFPTSFFHEEGVWNPFVRARRIYPMVYRDRYSVVMKTTMKLPDGFMVEELPEESLVEAPFGRFSFSCRVEGGELLIEKRMESMPARIPAADYDSIKEIYEELAQARKKQVVLRKSSPVSP